MQDQPSTTLEQLAFNQWVAGSSPARLKTLSKAQVYKPLTRILTNWLEVYVRAIC